MLAAATSATLAMVVTVLTQTAKRSIPLELERDSLVQIALARFAMMFGIVAIVAGIFVAFQEARKMRLPKEEREKSKNKISMAMGLMMFGLIGSIMPNLNLGKPSRTEQWRSHSEKAQQMFVAGQTLLAKDEYELALAALNPDLPGDIRKASTLIALAGIDQMQGNFADAETRAREALPILEHDANSTPKAKGICLVLLSNACYQQQKLEEAMRFAKQAIEVLSRGIGESAPELAQAYSVEGLIELTEQRSEESKASFEKALAIADAAPESTVANLGACLNNLALWNQAFGDDKAAEDFYQRSIRILEESPGERRGELAMALENYSLLLSELNREEEAAKLRERVTTLRGGL